VLFVGWLQNAFLPRMSHLRDKTKHQGKMVVILDGRAIHVTLRVITYAGPQGLSFIRFVPHPSQITRPIDLYIFGLLKTI
jgi:hypothetical protein